MVNALGGLVMAGFGVFVLRKGVGGRANGSFATFAIAFGLAVACRAVADHSDPADPWSTGFWAVASVFWLVAGIGIGSFGLSFPTRLKKRQRRLLILPVLVLIIPMVWTIGGSFLIVRSTEGWAAFDGTQGLYGPFSMMAMGVWQAVLVLLPLRHHVAAPLARSQIRWVAGVLTLFPAFSFGAFLLEAPQVALAASAFLALSAVLWLRESTGNEASKAARNLALLPFLMAFLGILLAALSAGYESGMFGAFGVVRVLSVAVLAYGILRAQLFDIDLKVKWTIRRGTLAAIFIAAIFIASEVAQEFFGAQTGSAYLGILVAGVLVFAIAPLQRLADRVADAAMPHVQESEDYLVARKQTIYRGAVESALIDGMMSVSERRLLLRLQDDLGLRGDDANLIEEEVLGRLAARDPRPAPGAV